MTKSKHVLIVFFLYVFLVQFAYAQERNFSFAIEYGPNASKLSNELVSEHWKLSHAVMLRLTHQNASKVKPTIGLGYMNTGYITKSDIGGQLGIEKVSLFSNYNYLFTTLGVKLEVQKYFLLPEIGLGVNLSNKTREAITFSDGSTSSSTNDTQLNFGEFNKITVPASLSIGRQLSIGNKVFSLGLRAYYGITQIVKNVERDNHYLGLGLMMGMDI